MVFGNPERAKCFPVKVSGNPKRAKCFPFEVSGNPKGQNVFLLRFRETREVRFISPFMFLTFTKVGKEGL